MQEPTEVEARFDAGGKVTLRSFTWRAQRQRITSQGRQWQAEDGLHILVMTSGERVFELLHQPGTGAWYILNGPKSLLTA